MENMYKFFQTVMTERIKIPFSHLHIEKSAVTMFVVCLKDHSIDCGLTKTCEFI